jgi:hypothetical protein
MPPLSRDAILTVLSGLTVLACSKTTTPTPEPVGSVAPAATAPAPAVSAAEVDRAVGQPSSSAGKEMTCAPGGCAPGQCGAGKK